MKLQRTTRWLSLVGLFLILVSLGIFLIVTRHQSTQIVQQQTVIQAKDTIIQQHARDSAISHQRTDTLTHQINTFFQFVNAHHYDSLQDLYADTLARYFTLGKNIPKTAARKWEKHSWSNEYRNSQFYATRPPVFTGDTAWVSGLFQEEKDVTKALVMQFQFNKNGQITFVRALYDK